MPIKSSDVVTFDHVAVEGRTELAVVCNVDGQSVSLGRLVIEPESTILNGHSHDGTLVIARWRAQELGLLNGTK